MNQNKTVKIVGFRQDFETALENAQKSATEYANALEREIAEKGLDFVVKRLRAKHQSEENKMSTQNIHETKKELILYALNAPTGSAIQVFRNQKGVISWSNPQTNTWVSDPENPLKEHPDTIGWVKACNLSDLCEGVIMRKDGKIGLDAEVWSNWIDEFGEPVEGEYYEKELVTTPEKLLTAQDDLVREFEFGFEFETSTEKC